MHDYGHGHFRGGNASGAPGTRVTVSVSTNLFAEFPARSDQEAFGEILARPGLRIERIVSFGQASPAGFWYDQPEGEWVVVLAGAARLRFEDEPTPRTLAPGDHVHIPPRCRHRVEWTDPARPTVWLAVRYG
ncbi:MAG: cupin domain-containing protein [Burkholderiales bacterium]|nr:cupin domain-containing protein [Burkholderiales bacterium]